MIFKLRRSPLFEELFHQTEKKKKKFKNEKDCDPRNIHNFLNTSIAALLKLFDFLYFLCLLSFCCKLFFPAVIQHGVYKSKRVSNHPPPPIVRI